MPEYLKKLKERLATGYHSVITETDESVNRMNICTACPHFSESLKICDQCGCFMPAKVKIAIAKCPIGNW